MDLARPTSPGRRRARPEPPAPGNATGLVVHLRRGDGAWTIKDSQRGIAEWTGPARSSAELDVCARCHARRRPIVDPHPYGQPFLDTHVPALLEPHLYHADGQVLGEVYEWGSFVQSRMQHAGVTCSDCHEPHRTTLRAPGNAVCAQCHLPAKFDTSAHHHHRPEAEGARCVSCHMPARTYMVVDPRRDHSFRVPRPDLSVALGTPNACTGCHANRTASWAAGRVAGWGGAARGTADFARTLEVARRGLPVAGPALAALATDRTQPGIVRATALTHLPEFPSAGARPQWRGRSAIPMPWSGWRRSGPWRRCPSIGVGRSQGPCSGIPCGRCGSLPSRPSREVPRRPGGGSAERFRPGAGRARQVRAGQRRPARGPREPRDPVRSPRPPGRRGVRAPHRAVARPVFRPRAGEPRRPPARSGSRRGRRALPGSGAPRGARPSRRRFTRSGSSACARTGCPRPSTSCAGPRGPGPASPRFAYVYAVALHDTGRARDAIAVLEAAHRQRPADRDTLAALATYLGEQGDVGRALGYAETLAALDPADGGARTLVETLRRRAGAR